MNQDDTYSSRSDLPKIQLFTWLLSNGPLHFFFLKITRFLFRHSEERDPPSLFERAFIASERKYKRGSMAKKSCFSQMDRLIRIGRLKPEDSRILAFCGYLDEPIQRFRWRIKELLFVAIASVCLVSSILGWLQLSYLLFSSSIPFLTALLFSLGTFFFITGVTYPGLKIMVEPILLMSKLKKELSAPFKAL